MFLENFEILESLDGSTNDYIKKTAEDGVANARAVLALFQSGGRGRYGRSWDGGRAGENIALSLCYKTSIGADKVSFITLVSALAVRDGIHAACGVAADIKYPNDLIIGGRKICGILTELIKSDDSGCELVIGVGVNLNRKAFPGEIRDRASSIYLESGICFDAETVSRAILEAFDERLARFERGGFEQQREEYEAAMTVRRGELESYEDLTKMMDT